MLESLSTGQKVFDQLDDLARFTDEPGQLTRPYLSPSHKGASLQVREWMEAAGMAVRIDAVGNVVGRYEGKNPDRPALLIGSHIDTVRNAGKYDGNLGVVAAIAAVAELNARGERLPCTIEVLAFGDEEGVRFPVTLTASRAVAGTLDLSALDARDADGISVREALEQFGCDPSGASSVARRREDVAAYVELHIEQGPVLQAEELPVGVVTAINGASRFTIEVTGTAGHAGTVPMELRSDALAAAAAMILAVERVALETEALVATVGKIEALPGAVNVIPSGANFTLDIRSPSDAVRKGAIDRLEEELTAIGRRRGVRVRLTKTYDEPAATCAPWLVAQFSDAVARTGIQPYRLPSGAGHDGLAMVELCPIGMLFVRCKDGISHNPAESITPDDADAAVRVLVDFIRHFAPPA